MSMIRLLHASIWHASIWLAMVGLMLATATGAPAAPKAAIFPFELLDVSIEGSLGGPRDEEARRLALVTEELRQLVARDGSYELLDLSGLAADIERAAPLHKCNGCEADLARQVGAGVAITGTVRKVSSLILNFFVHVRDVPSGKLTRVLQADIRGNTDETWLRGIRWLAANRLFAEQKP